MRIHFFRVPADGTGSEAEALNQVLTRQRVRDLERQFVDLGADSYWAICVTTAGADAAETPDKRIRQRVDYRQLLAPAEFDVFADLRAKRKELAARDAVPVYQVMSNEQLATMVERRVTTRQALGALPGVGEARLAKYAEPFLTILRASVAALGQESQAPEGPGAAPEPSSSEVSDAAPPESSGATP